MTLLAIDDDASQLELLKLYCASLEYPRVSFLAALDYREGRAILERESVDLVLTDLSLPDGTGRDILLRAKELNPLTPVVVMTASSDPLQAIEALKAGADDYLLKPTRREEIERLVIRINEKSTLISELLLPAGAEPAPAPASVGLVYRSQAMARVLDTALRAAGSDAIVLIAGESGTGKELVARFVHAQSSRRLGPFVPVNVSALPESLAEAELFGHRKGAFTGATADRIGRFEEAEGGSLFLDEVGDINLGLQVKLLRVIQFGQVERVGENAARSVNARIIAATNRDLAAMVAAGRFREDLYYRLNIVGITLPPLRMRKEDIPLLIEHFLARFNRKNGRAIKGLSREATELLMRHGYPGNVRELENLIERAVVLCRGDLILGRDLPALGEDGKGAASGPEAGGYEERMRSFETELLKAALERAGGNQSRAARELGIGERKLRSRMERIGLAPKAST